MSSVLHCIISCRFRSRYYSVTKIGIFSQLKKKMAEREHEQRRYETLQKRARNGRAKRDMKEEEKRLRGYFLTNADIICCTLSGAGSKHMVNTFRNEWNIR